MAAESFPAYHVTGAIFHFIRTPALPNIISFLGTCEVMPEVRVMEMSANVMNDEAGKMLPGQKTDQGQMATIGLQLSRYSEASYQSLQLTRGSGNGLQTGLGMQGRFSRGSTIFGNKTFELWQVFENSLNVQYRGMQAIGRYWPQVELRDHGPIKTGTQENILLLSLEAQPWRIPQASYAAVSGIERSWVLWQENDAAFPADVLVPQ